MFWQTFEYILCGFTTHVFLNLYFPPKCTLVFDHILPL